MEKSEIVQPDGAIKQPGEYVVTVGLHPEISIDIKVTVRGEGRDGKPYVAAVDEDNTEAAADKNAENTPADNAADDTT